MKSSPSGPATKTGQGHLKAKLNLPLRFLCAPPSRELPVETYRYCTRKALTQILIRL